MSIWNYDNDRGVSSVMVLFAQTSERVETEEHTITDGLIHCGWIYALDDSPEWSSMVQTGRDQCRTVQNFTRTCQSQRSCLSFGVKISKTVWRIQHFRKQNATMVAAEEGLGVYRPHFKPNRRPRLRGQCVSQTDGQWWGVVTFGIQPRSPVLLGKRWGLSQPVEVNDSDWVRFSERRLGQLHLSWQDWASSLETQSTILHSRLKSEGKPIFAFLFPVISCMKLNCASQFHTFLNNVAPCTTVVYSFPISITLNSCNFFWLLNRTNGENAFSLCCQWCLHQMTTCRFLCISQTVICIEQDIKELRCTKEMRMREWQHTWTIKYGLICCHGDGAVTVTWKEKEGCFLHSRLATVSLETPIDENKKLIPSVVQDSSDYFSDSCCVWHKGSRVICIYLHYNRIMRLSTVYF